MSEQLTARRRLSIGSRVSHELLFTPFVVNSDKDRLLDVRMICQRCFNLAELDTKPTHLDLMIAAPAIFDISIGQIATDVTHSEQPRAGLFTERMRHKPLSRQCGTIEITARESFTTDADLANCTHGSGLKIRVENIEIRIRDRPANRNGTEFVSVVYFLARDIYSYFRRVNKIN